jgi:two-component system, NtrC family, sensor kinase
MKLFIFLLLFPFGLNYCLAQDSTVNLSKAMFDKNQVITLFALDGWLFREGNDSAWAGIDINTTGWKKLKPTQISKKMGDRSGKIEGWFRLKIKFDSSFGDMPLYLGTFNWAASDIYVDGNLFHSDGSTGINGKVFKGSNPINIRPISVIHPNWGEEHNVAIHFVNYIPHFPLNLITEDAAMGPVPILSGPALMPNAYDFHKENAIYQTIWITVSIVLSLLFWLLAFQNPREKNLPLIALCSTCFGLSALLARIQESKDLLLAAFLTVHAIQILFTISMVLLTLVILAKVFKNKVPRKLVIFLSTLLIIAYYNLLFSHIMLLTIIIAIAAVIIALYYIFTSWKILKGAQWAIVAGVMTALFWVLLWVIMTWRETETTPLSIRYALVISITGIYLSFPLSLLVYVSLRFREIISEVRENARRVIQVTEEKRQQSLNQQKLLEEEVKKQTADLRETLENLRSTQSQLIQSEKMASLGELTAGIAHEIQNPLNFINNFSEVNKELLVEMKDEMDKGNLEDAKTIANDVIDNQEKINHHGKRADAIVKGMLQHSRTSSGQKEPTDINALADEYLRLAYHGLRAKDKSFNATMKTDFDERIGKINIVPQDIGRVILNLINNAFYALDEKRKSGVENYEPTVSVSTRKVNGKVDMRVKDNGNGIPQKVLDKIFQPFFTTKPTGQGTGLGLSLSYDIIKAHGGELKVETKEGEGSTFIIHLPRQQ